ncbi:prepilin-type N-terminal cleavage/methylation domain-containing protein, partial [bacterium]|nr:prepilin-type N-terminal cleavage/methylation domain-containing protein [bacterium]
VLSLHNQRGFSLVELMVSVGIMSVTLLLVMAVFTTSMRAGQKSVDLAAGVLVAETVLTKDVYDVVHGKGEGVASGSSVDSMKANLLNGDGSVVMSGIKELNNTTFIWELKSTKLSGVDIDADISDLLKLDVEVWWYKTGSNVDALENGEMGSGRAWNSDSERKNKSRAGFGILHCSMSRLYNASADL